MLGLVRVVGNRPNTWNVLEGCDITGETDGKGPDIWKEKGLCVCKSS